MKCLLKALVVGLTNEQLDTFEISRIGQPRSNQNRGPMEQSLFEKRPTPRVYNKKSENS